MASFFLVDTWEQVFFEGASTIFKQNKKTFVFAVKSAFFFYDLCSNVLCLVQCSNVLSHQYLPKILSDAISALLRIMHYHFSL